MVKTAFVFFLKKKVFILAYCQQLEVVLNYYENIHELNKTCILLFFANLPLC